MNAGRRTRDTASSNEIVTDYVVVCMERVDNDASFRGRVSDADHRALGRQILCVLLWVATVLVIYGALPLVFELRLFVVLGWVVASGIAYVLLGRANQSEVKAAYDERLSQISVAHAETVMKMAAYSEARDAFTEEHIQRVQKIAYQLAVGLGECEESALAIGMAAMIHDLGNIGIPEAVLGMPRRLTEDEFNLVKTHVIIGENVIGDSPPFELEREATRHHHEWWDGEGYPDGIAGEEIPLVARITAVADVFDALITKRPHRDAWPLDRAVDCLKERSGTQFDPHVVEVFLDEYLRGRIALPPSVAATGEHEAAAPKSSETAPAFLRKHAPSEVQQQGNVESASDTGDTRRPAERSVVRTDGGAFDSQQQSNEDSSSDTDESRQARDASVVAADQRAKENHGQANRENETESDESNQARDSEIVSTGDTLLDQKLGGGVPVGSLTLIEGESGAGKSVLAQHFISSALKNERRVVLYSSENTESSLLSQMDSLGMDVAESLIERNLRVLVMPAGNTARKAPIKLETLLKHMSRMRDWDLLVVDSLAGFLASESDENLLAFFTGCKQYHSQGKTVITIVHTNAISESNLTRVASVCDVYLRLRIQADGDKLVKSLEVAKVRGANDTTGGIFSFDVEAGLGIVPLMVTTKVQS